MPFDSEARYPFPEEEIKRLRERRWILRYFPKNSIGMEIGVFRGHFSEVIAEIVQPKKLYLLDPWTKLGQHFGWGKAYTNFDSLPTSVAKSEVEEKMKRHNLIETIIVEEFSQDYLPFLKDALDWVYLDSSHDYRQTYDELCLVDRVLTGKGFIAGDDWALNVNHKHHGVFRAVNEFVKSHDYQFVAAGRGGQWCLRKTPDYGPKED